MPWNTLLANSGYYSDTRLANFEPAKSIFPYFAIIFMTIKFLFVIFSSFIIHLISPERQVIFSGIGNTLVFFFLTLLSMDTRENATFSDASYFGIVLTLCFMAAIFCAFLNNALYTILGRYNPQHTQAISNGQGLAGMLPLVVKIIMIYSCGDSSITYLETCLTYAVSTLVMLACIMLFIIYHGQDHSDHFFKVSDPQSKDTMDYKNDPEISQANNENENNCHSSYGMLLHSYVRIFRYVGWYAITAMLIYFITLGMFPLFYFKVSSVYLTPLSSNFFYDKVFMFVNLLLFNVGDWIGKFVPCIQMLIINNRFILFSIAIARIIYIPLFLMSNVTGFTASYPLSLKFASDIAFYLIAFTFGLTNGYISTVAMMTGPTVVPNDNDRSKAGAVMVFFLTLGLTLGVYLSFILNHVFNA